MGIRGRREGSALPTRYPSKLCHASTPHFRTLEKCTRGRVVRAIVQMPSSVNAVGLNASVELKVGTTDVRSQSADNAEFEGGVNVGKEDSFVLEVIEPDEAIRFSDGGEEVFGRFVRGDAGGREQADAAVGGDELVGQLGEDGVEIDVAAAGERIFSRRAAVGQQGVGGGEGLLVALVKGRGGG